MKKSAWAKRIQEILDREIPHPEIPLKHQDPYTLLIAVLLSAQCTDERVNQVTPRLFKEADSAKKMAALPLETIEAIIKPIGLTKTKAKAIKALSSILTECYGGAVPASFEALEALPGVGHKTASVVMAGSFHIPAFPVDTHIHRSAKRWGLSKGKNVQEVERDLKKLFPKESWNRLHLQIILFARRFCPARNHLKEACPICKELKM